MSTARRIASGLLTGAGKGMVAEAEERRQQVLKDLEHQRLLERDETNYERRKGLLTSVIPSKDGTLMGITAGGETKDLGFKGKPTVAELKALTDSAGLSVEDKRIIDTLVKRFTTGKGSLEGEQTDWSSVEQALRTQNRNDLADLIASQDQGSAAIDVESAEWREARSQAEEEASEKTGLLTSRKKEFPETEGSKAKWIEQRSREIYSERQGGKKGAPGGDSASTETTVDAGGQAPQGAGTQANPYKATTQAHIDWFKANAPAGSVIEINGTLYQK